MCGIIGAASSRSVGKILIKGLQLMEYRGYDSAGVVLNKDEEILRLRSLGKVSKLVKYDLATNARKNARRCSVCTRT